jgi:hypothetical protein
MIARVVTTVIAIAFAVVSAVMPAWAGGPADNPTCFIAKKTNTALPGTISANVQNALTQGNTDVDFTLRLSGDNGKTFTFFRASVNMQVFSRSNAGIICALLFDVSVPPAPPTPQAALDLRAAILSHFGLSPTAQFFLTSASLSNDEVQGSTGQWFCNSTLTDPSVLAGPCNPQRGGSMADVILYVK